MTARLRPVPAIAPRAVLYLRQSIARDDSISIELQEIAGRDHCAQHGYEVVAVEVDEGISGRTWSKRPAVQRVLDMIEAQQADVIVLWKWSRLSRSRKDWALAADRVDVAGGRIESATEPIDTATASGRFARGVMTEYAAFQSEQIGEQWTEVKQRRFNMGLPPGGTVPWGWTSRRDHIAVSDEAAATIRHAYQMYFEGRGFTNIARWMNKQGIRATRGGEWTAATVKSWLDSPVHAGRVIYRGQIADGAHTGILSDTDYERYRHLRMQRAIPKRNHRNRYLLSSLVVCHCGTKRVGRFTRSPWGNREKVYYSYVCPALSSHPAKSITMSRVDKVIVEWLLALKVTAVSEPSAAPMAEIERISREIVAAEKSLDALTEHLLSGLVPQQSYERTRDKLLGEISRLRETLTEAERSKVLDPSVFIASLGDLVDAWPTLQMEDKQVAVRSVIDHVVILEGGRVEIHPHWGGEPHVVAAQTLKRD